MHDTENMTDTGTSNAPQKEESFFSEILKFSLIAILIVLPIRLFIAQPFIVSGASMLPAFENGQYLVIDQISYNLDAPRRGEVIVFKYPRDPSKFFIKRIVGLPGETVRIEGNRVEIINKEHPKGIILEEPYLDPANIQRDSVTTTLGSFEYFVLGDNRKASSDSRIWGPLAEEFIIGKAFLRLFPLTQTDLLPGDFSTESL